MTVCKARQRRKCAPLLHVLQNLRGKRRQERRQMVTWARRQHTQGQQRELPQAAGKGVVRPTHQHNLLPVLAQRPPETRYISVQGGPAGSKGCRLKLCLRCIVGLDIMLDGDTGSAMLRRVPAHLPSSSVQGLLATLCLAGWRLESEGRTTAGGKC